MSGKGSVIIYKGKFLYDVVNVFSDLVADAFKEAGYTPFVIDLRQGTSFIEELKKVVEKGGCKLIFSFAGAGAELLLSNGKLLHEMIPLPFIAAMVDDPAHFPQRFTLPNIVIGCLDESHCDYIQHRFNGERMAVFLPHGGCPPSKPFDGPFQERPHELVFPGSYLDYVSIEAKFASMPETARKIVYKALDIFEAGDEIPAHEAIIKAFIALGGNPGQNGNYAFILDELFNSFEHLVRARRRSKALKALDEAGIPVEIYGEGWPKGLFKCHRTFPPLPFPEMLNLMAHSKIVLSMRAVPGSHERVPSAAMAGALALSDFNSCIAAQFIEGSEIAFYRWTRIEELPAIAGKLISDLPATEKMASAGKAKAFACHSWRNRVDLLLSTLGLP